MRGVPCTQGCLLRRALFQVVPKGKLEKQVPVQALGTHIFLALVGMSLEFPFHLHFVSLSF